MRFDIEQEAFQVGNAFLQALDQVLAVVEPFGMDFNQIPDGEDGFPGEIGISFKEFVEILVADLVSEIGRILWRG